MSPVQIGPYRLRNPFALAPMAGLSDVPFRSVAWRMGCGYQVSEMVSSKPELWETGKSRLRRVPVPGAQPVAVQIAGTEPGVLADAARRHVDDGVQVIDINFGCPAKKVCRKAAGSALLADTDLIARIINAVANAVPVPVTMKIRTGLVPGDGLGLAAALAGEAAGAQMIVVHGRSRACRFHGAVDPRPISAIKARVRVPVLANGDVDSAQAARDLLAVTGADGVMIGRGALGQPWLFCALNGEPVPDMQARWRCVLDHVAHMHDFYGAEQGLRIARKHVAAYLARLRPGADVAEFQSLACADAQLHWLGALAEQPAQAA